MRTAVTVQGTLRADGTLELDEKPDLSPGRVTVVLRPEDEPAPAQDDWWQFMQQARRDLEAAGQSFMNEEEVSAHLEWLREGDRTDELLQQVDEETRPE